jgi:hypothetical protein
MPFPYSWPISEKDIRGRLFNLGSTSRRTCYEFFFPSHFLKKERKASKLPTISLLLLETKHVNLKTTLTSSSIKISKEVTISISFYTFRVMDMVEFNVSFNNQSPLNRLKT